jgi:hypothetical protein
LSLSAFLTKLIEKNRTGLEKWQQIQDLIIKNIFSISFLFSSSHTKAEVDPLDDDDEPETMEDVKTYRCEKCPETFETKGTV